MALNRREPRGALGFLTDVSEDNESGGRHWGVEFWSTAKAPLTVRVPESILAAAGVILEKDAIAEADINYDAVLPEQVDPQNFHGAGMLPDLNTVMLPESWLRAPRRTE